VKNSTMRNQALVLAFFAAGSCLPMMAQAPEKSLGDLLASLAANPTAVTLATLRDTAIDWNGTWRAEVGGLLNSRVVELSIRQTESTIFVKDMNDASRTFLKVILEAAYSGHDTFGGLVFPGSDQEAKVTLTSKDPDTIVMTPGWTYHRHSPPALNDIPCSTAKPPHVSADGAIAREKVAIVAKAAEQAACWSYIAALTGDTDSLYAAGYFLRRGIGVEKDLTLAYHFMQHSALQGNYQAQLEAAEMAERGEGETPNPVMARRFREMAQMQVAVEQMRRNMDGAGRIDKGLEGIFGRSSSDYPGSECGWSYAAYQNWKTQGHSGDPCRR
jgi:hypothetical protein